MKLLSRKQCIGMLLIFMLCISGCSKAPEPGVVFKQDLNLPRQNASMPFWDLPEMQNNFNEQTYQSTEIFPMVRVLKPYCQSGIPETESNWMICHRLSHTAVVKELPIVSMQNILPPNDEEIALFIMQSNELDTTFFNVHLLEGLSLFNKMVSSLYMVSNIPTYLNLVFSENEKMHPNNGYVFRYVFEDAQNELSYRVELVQTVQGTPSYGYLRMSVADKIDKVAQTKLFAYVDMTEFMSMLDSLRELQPMQEFRTH